MLMRSVLWIIHVRNTSLLWQRLGPYRFNGGQTGLKLIALDAGFQLSSGTIFFVPSRGLGGKGVHWDVVSVERWCFFFFFFFPGGCRCDV